MATSRVIYAALRRLKIQNARYSSCLSVVPTNLQSHGHHEAKIYKAKRHPLGWYINKRWRSSIAEEEAEHEPEKMIEEDKGDFDRYGISQETQQALRANGIHKLFPVQYLAYETVENGNDVIVKARTGTGKTLSFALPLVEKLLYRRNRKGALPKAIVLTPTRELATQVEEHIQRLNDKIRVTCIYGGTSYQLQKNAISRGLDIVVGTPGRVNDLIDQHVLKLDEIEHVVLDEVDRMLDMGFQDIVNTILSHCYREERKPQTLMFSATVPQFVHQAARQYLSKNVFLIDLIGDDNVQSATTVKQMALQSDKITPILLKNLINAYCEAGGKTIIFCERKTECDEVSSSLPGSQALHGDINQSRRQDVLSDFRSGKIDILVTTDVASRGLDIPEVDLVIQTKPPKDKENFIHRTGRTGRAGKPGNAIMIYRRMEERELRACEYVANVKLMRIPIPMADMTTVIRKSVQCLKRIDTEDAVEFFGEQAKQLQEEMGTVESLSAALMAVSELKDIGSQSLLSMRKSYRTFLFQSDGETVSTNEFRQILDDVLGNEANKILDVIKTYEGKGLVLDVPVDLVKSLKEGIASGYPNATLKRLLLLPSDVNSQARDSRSHEFATDYGNRRPSGFGERERRPSGFGDRERRDFGYHGRNQSFGRGYGRSGDGGREGLYRRDHRRNGEFRYQDRNRSYERNFRRDSSEYDGNYELRDQGEDDVDVNNSFMPYR